MPHGQGMSAYLPIELDAFRDGNPFPVCLRDSFVSAGLRVEVGLSGLARNPGQWDAVCIQWPESLLAWRSPRASDVDSLDDWLRVAALRSAIVTTVHNETQHADGGASSDRLFRTVYRRTRAFVHLGATSRGVTESRYPEETKGKLHVVIPHGNYAILGPGIETTAARRHLGLPESRPVVLVIGSIRHLEELQIVEWAARYLRREGATLAFAGKIGLAPAGSGAFGFARRLSARLREAALVRSLQRNASVVRVPAPVPHERMPAVASAADVVLIPRRLVLNSGVVPLGFTFGKVVVGPRHGVVGEILEANANPTFPIDAGPGDIAHAIAQGLALSRQGRGAANAQVACTHWDWGRIGADYAALLRTLREVGT